MTDGGRDDKVRGLLATARVKLAKAAVHFAEGDTLGAADMHAEATRAADEAGRLDPAHECPAWHEEREPLKEDARPTKDNRSTQ